METAPLESLADEQSALVAGYDPRMPAPRRRRFEDLGLISGTPVLRERNAPLGDPVVFQVRGTMICIRRAEARWILVRCDAP